VGYNVKVFKAKFGIRYQVTIEPREFLRLIYFNIVLLVDVDLMEI
jgi:hypothetical protein